MKGLNHKGTLLLAIGNSGRQDDGLGWAFAEALEKKGLFEGEIHYRYQLQVEDAELASGALRVVFVDAFKGSLPDGFRWQPCMPAAEFQFSTHAISPASILFLCQLLYGYLPEAWELVIQGDHWELETGLSPASAKRMERALAFFDSLMAG